MVALQGHVVEQTQKKCSKLGCIGGSPGKAQTIYIGDPGLIPARVI